MYIFFSLGLCIDKSNLQSFPILAKIVMNCTFDSKTALVSLVTGELPVLILGCIYMISVTKIHQFYLIFGSC